VLDAPNANGVVFWVAGAPNCTAGAPASALGVGVLEKLKIPPVGALEVVVVGAVAEDAGVPNEKTGAALPDDAVTPVSQQKRNRSNFYGMQHSVVIINMLNHTRFQNLKHTYSHEHLFHFPKYA